MLDKCRDRGLPYGYFVDTLGPRLLRGSLPGLDQRRARRDGPWRYLNELDTRALRSDLTAAGSDPLVSNRSGIPFASIVSPSVLFDELEVNERTIRRRSSPTTPRRRSAPRTIEHASAARS